MRKNNEYRKRQSRNTSYGFDYQMDWSMLYILRAENLRVNEKIINYQIASENEGKI